MKGFFGHWVDQTVAQLPCADQHPGMVANAQCVARLADDIDQPVALRDDAIDAVKLALRVLTWDSYPYGD